MDFLQARSLDAKDLPCSWLPLDPSEAASSGVLLLTEPQAGQA